MTPLLAANVYYHLPVLLVVVSLVYSAARHDRWPRILREAAGWVVRMVGFLGGLGGALYLLSTYPHLWPYAAAVAAVVAVVYYLASWGLLRRPKPVTEEEAKKSA